MRAQLSGKASVSLTVSGPNLVETSEHTPQVQIADEQSTREQARGVSLRQLQEWEKKPLLRAKFEAVRLKALLAKNARL